MEKLAILLFDMGIIIFYLLIGFIIFMTIQLISYRIFKFNLYKYIMYNLIDKYICKYIVLYIKV